MTDILSKHLSEELEVDLDGRATPTQVETGPATRVAAAPPGVDRKA